MQERGILFLILKYNQIGSKALTNRGCLQQHFIKHGHRRDCNNTEYHAHNIKYTGVFRFAAIRLGRLRDHGRGRRARSQKHHHQNIFPIGMYPQLTQAGKKPCKKGWDQNQPDQTDKISSPWSKYLS